jgi:hypothetical protein
LQRLQFQREPRPEFLQVRLRAVFVEDVPVAAEKDVVALVVELFMTTCEDERSEE